MNRRDGGAEDYDVDLIDEPALHREVVHACDLAHLAVMIDTHQAGGAGGRSKLGIDGVAGHDEIPGRGQPR